MLDLMNGHIIVGGDTAYEYRSEYDSATGITYEGWTEWVSGGVSTAASVWRLSKTTETVSGTESSITQIFAGAGAFIYAWDGRVAAFTAADVTGVTMGFGGMFHLIYP